MLRKYFSKSRHQLSLDNANTAVVINSTNDCNEQNVYKNSKRHSLRSSSSFSDDVLQSALATDCEFNDEESIRDEDIFKYVSRLSMSLSGVIGDPICLSHFVQYLEEKRELALIKFYLDIENFKRVAITQLQKEKLKISEETEIKNDDVALDLTITEGNVPELRTLYDLSMRKPLTDDEKSQIYADVSKQITNKYGSQLSLCSTNTDAEQSVSGDVIIGAASTADAMAIYQKYLSCNATLSVNLPIDILAQISLILCQNESDETTRERLICVNCFDESQQWVLQQLECNHLCEFLQSKYYCIYCLELIENMDNSSKQQLNICDILYSEATLFFFMEFLEQHNERECLDFWTQAINYRKSFNETNVEYLDAQADAMIIYEKYFSLQAKCALWMSDKLRSHVEQLICNEQVAFCYDLPIRLTAHYLQRKYLQDFLKSQLFTNYVIELKHKVKEVNSAKQFTNIITLDSDLNAHAQISSLKQKHRKTRSEGYISQHNTLLAMDTSRLKNLHVTANMNIDARHITEPQLLWYRSSKCSKNLRFGSINALGRYERDFESVDAANGKTNNWSLSAGSNKLKNVMRKFVKLPEDKMQEEIAWQVAEMIVNDVTRITLKNVEHEQIHSDQLSQ